MLAGGFVDPSPVFFSYDAIPYMRSGGERISGGLVLAFFTYFAFNLF